jgi:hypothetical protein
MNNAMLYITIGPEVEILFSHWCVYFAAMIPYVDEGLTKISFVGDVYR